MPGSLFPVNSHKPPVACRIRVRPGVQASSSAVCWVAFQHDECPLIVNVQHEIQTKLQLEPVSLFLDGALLPENEPSGILRDGDLICVKPHIDEERILSKVRKALTDGKTSKKSSATKKRSRKDDSDEDQSVEDVVQRHKRRKTSSKRTVDKVDSRTHSEAASSKEEKKSKSEGKKKKSNHANKEVLELKEVHEPPRRKKEPHVPGRRKSETEGKGSDPKSVQTEISKTENPIKTHKRIPHQDGQDSSPFSAESETADGTDQHVSTSKKKRRRGQRGRRGRRRQADSGQDTTTRNDSELRVVAAHEAQENYTVPVRVSRNYSTKSYTQWQAVQSIPPVGAYIAFKIIEMTADYSPGLSDFKEGEVIVCNPVSRHLTIKLAPHSVEVDKHWGGRFELEELDVTSGPPDQIETEWDLLLDVRIAPV